MYAHTLKKVLQSVKTQPYPLSASTITSSAGHHANRQPTTATATVCVARQKARYQSVIVRIPTRLGILEQGARVTSASSVFWLVCLSVCLSFSWLVLGSWRYFSRKRTRRGRGRKVTASHKGKMDRTNRWIAILNAYGISLAIVKVVFSLGVSQYA